MTLIPHRITAPRKFALSLGMLVVILGLSVLVGWMLNIAALKSVFPGLVTMKPNTAMGLLLCGGTLAILSGREAGKSIKFGTTMIAVVVAVFGLLTLIEYLGGWKFGIDQWLFHDPTASTEAPYPGRMSPATAFCFILTGGALWTAVQPAAMRLRLPILGALGVVVIMVNTLALAGSVSDALFGLRWWNYTGMAIHTTAGFLLLGFGLLALIKGDGEFAWSLDTFTTSGFVIGILSLVMATGISYHFTRQLQQTAALVSHTQEVLKEIEMVTADVATLGSDQRSYINTGHEDWLERVAKTKDAIHQELNELRELTADTPGQQSRLDQLEPLIAQRIDWGEQTVAVRRQQGLSAAEQIIAAGKGIELSDGIRNLIKEMEDQEYSLLDQWQKKEQEVSTTTFLLLPLGVFLSLTVLSLGLFFLNAGVDVTKRAQAQVQLLNAELEQRVIKRTAELEAANKELEAFSYSVSHDLRAPLRAVNGFAGIVLEDFGSHLPEDGRRYLERIRNGGRQMGELIDDLLGFSRLGRQAVDRQDVNMLKLVQDVLEELKSQRAGRQIEISVGNLPSCQGDLSLLKQIWVNLISNAVKYTRERAPAIIEIGCTREKGGHIYFIRDNGAGFDMQYANKLFGVFQRLHRSDEFEGTGVGLAIVQRIVHRHNGSVWAQAELNRGATFYFTLEEGKKT
jgi:signal transduction histidine kinase